MNRHETLKVGERTLLKRKIFLRNIVALLAIVVYSTPLVWGQDSSLHPSEEETDVFILRQLIEIKNELRDIQGEMTELRKAVSNMESLRTVPNPAGEAPAESVTLHIEEDDPILGNREASVAVVEFTDFQCPYCSQYHTDTFPQVKKEFIDTGKIQYIVRDFPLEFHDHAKAAAIAANCAGQQNAYWQMNDLLFSQQGELGGDLYQEAAKSLGLNEDKFLTCLKLEEQEQEVAADLASGKQIGIDGTPTFFVGLIQDGQVVDAKKIVGAQRFTTFSQLIKPYLSNGTK